MQTAMRLLTLVVLVALAGCTSYANRPDSTPGYLFELGPGDVISILVFEEPTLGVESLTIAPDGRVQVPLAGEIEVAGLTPQQVADLLQERYGEYVQDVRVNVRLLELRSQLVHLIGEVRAPGSFPYREGMTAIEALQLGGSFNPVTTDQDDLRVVRGSLVQPIVYRIDLEALLMGHEDEDARDMLLQPGDIVYVAPRTVTEVDRYLSQLLSPIYRATGAASALGP